MPGEAVGAVAVRSSEVCRKMMKKCGVKIVNGLV